MIKISQEHIWYGITIVVCFLLLGGVTILYTTDTVSVLQEKITDIRTPENFVGGLTAVHEGADMVKPTEVVELKDGDTFDLTATIVTQEIGNRMVKRLAYNGQIPGPVLKVEKGAKITVNLTNNIDMETALHSHGLRGDWKFDGMVPTSQDPIPVGGTFTYELEFPDTGVFWYHPHIREDYQQELGLYGNMIVSESGYWNKVDQEEYLIFDDILENGDFDRKIVTHTLMGRYGDRILINDSEKYQVKVKQGEITRLFLTNVANTRTFEIDFKGSFAKLVGGDNGAIEKEVDAEKTIIGPSERYVVELMYQDAGVYPILNRGQQIGEVVVEASTAFKIEELKQFRTNKNEYSAIRNNMSELFAREPDKRLRLDIVLKDSTKSDTLGQVDSDGNVVMMGVQMSKEKAIEHCAIMPQMAECEVLLGGTDVPKVTLVGKEMTEAQARQYCLLAPTTENCDKYKTEGVDAFVPHMHADGIEWEDGMIEVNQLSSNETIQWIIEDQATAKINSEIDWTFNRGDMVKVRVFNDGKGLHPMQHPLHFHGQRFVVLGRDGVVNDNLQWKDTVLIPMGQTVDLLIDMSNPGTWMSHCHIAEHLSSGMMFNFSVN